MSGPGGNDEPAIGGYVRGRIAGGCGVGGAGMGEEVLEVCLDANVPPWSLHDGAKGGGFDLAVADAVARRIGRQLALEWFETKPDRDDSTTLAANALLSDRRCRLVGGYPWSRARWGSREQSRPECRILQALGPPTAGGRSSSEFWCRVGPITSRR